MERKKNETIVKVVSVDDVRNHEWNEYNKQEWNRKIDRYIELDKDAEFFLVEKDECRGWDRIYVRYTANEINFFKELSYHSVICDGGFYEVMMFEYERVGNELVPYPEGRVKIVIREFQDSQGKCGPIGNDEKSRQFMRKMSKHYMVFTKEFYL